MQNIYAASLIIAFVAFTYASPIRDDDQMDILRRERRQGKDMNMSTTAMQTMTRQLGLPVGAQPGNTGLYGFGTYPGGFPGMQPINAIGSYPGGVYPGAGIYGNGFYPSPAGVVDPNQLNALVNLANQPGLFSQSYPQPFLQPGFTGIPTNPYLGAQYPQTMLG